MRAFHRVASWACAALFVVTYVPSALFCLPVAEWALDCCQWHEARM